MKFLIITILCSSFAFPSEKEGSDPCEGLRRRADRIQNEISKVSYELAQTNGGPEEASVSSSSTENGSFNCEEDGRSNRSILISRRDKLNSELVDTRKDIKRVCPRVYPE